jgi:hypothetical protein
MSKDIEFRRGIVGGENVRKIREKIECKGTLRREISGTRLISKNQTEGLLKKRIQKIFPDCGDKTEFAIHASYQSKIYNRLLNQIIDEAKKDLYSFCDTCFYNNTSGCPKIAKVQDKSHCVLEKLKKWFGSHEES